MKTLLSILAIWPQGPSLHRSFDIGHGYRVSVAQGGTDQNYSDQYYASTIIVGHGASTVATVKTRSLLEDWMKSDSVWGGHDLANQIKYLDRPREGVVGGVQASVYEVVPAEGGCLLRMAVIDVSQSFPTVNRDVIVRWNATAPDAWQVLYSFDDVAATNWQTILIPRFHGADYLLDNRSLYRLGKDPSKRTLVTTLPPEGRRDQGIPTPLWLGIKQIGSRLIVVQTGSDVEHELFGSVDLLTGKTAPVSVNQLKKLGVVRPAHIGVP